MKLLFLALVAFVTGDMASETASASLAGYYRPRPRFFPQQKRRMNRRQRYGHGLFKRNNRSVGRRNRNRFNRYRQGRKMGARRNRRRRTGLSYGARKRYQRAGEAGGRQGRRHRRHIRGVGGRQGLRSVRQQAVMGRNDRRRQEHGRNRNAAQRHNRRDVRGRTGRNKFRTMKNNITNENIRFSTNHRKIKSSDTGNTDFTKTSSTRNMNDQMGHKDFNDYKKQLDEGNKYNKYRNYGKNNENLGRYYTKQNKNDKADKAYMTHEDLKAAKDSRLGFKRYKDFNNQVARKKYNDDTRADFGKYGQFGKQGKSIANKSANFGRNDGMYATKNYKDGNMNYYKR